ncbi:MAG: 50S ribosomal protein L11 methyltransferase [Chloroflexota bacterium]|nr:50S ribosomal protein L11 methyltransferase [Chloroflexota bacterium]
MAEPQSPIRWLQVKFRTNGELAEALAELLGRFVSNGVVMESVTEFDAHAQENNPTGLLDVSGYLPVDEHLEETRQKLEEALWHMSQIQPLPEPTYTPVQDEDWMAAWKSHYTPVLVGQNLLILPAWQPASRDETRTLIRINPAMAFGTGTHPTTQLILTLLEKYIQPGEPLIDIGCGSGILSIAALKLGASHALAVDVSNAAVLSTMENAGLNGLSPVELETGKGSVEEILTDRYSMMEAPLVLVNILAPIILRLFDDGLAGLVAPGGTLLLSGLLEHQEAEVIQRCEAEGFTFLERETQADWVSLAMKKREA